MKWVMALAAMCFALGCSTVGNVDELTPAGKQVKLVEKVPDTCEQVGKVYGQAGGSMSAGKYVEHASLRQGADDDARNSAAEMGATHIVVVDERKTASTANVTAWAYVCP